MDYTIRPAQKSDASTMYDLSVRAHTQSYYEELVPATSLPDFMKHYQPSRQKCQRFASRLYAKIDNDSWFVLVAESHGLVIGYTIGQRISSKLVQLKGLFVDPVYHRHGIGPALLKASLDVASGGVTVRLSVIAANTVARNVYDSYGFMAVGKEDKAFFGAELTVMERKQ